MEEGKRRSGLVRVKGLGGVPARCRWVSPGPESSECVLLWVSGGLYRQT